MLNFTVGQAPSYSGTPLTEGRPVGHCGRGQVEPGFTVKQLQLWWSEWAMNLWDFKSRLPDHLTTLPAFVDLILYMYIESE